MIEIARAHYLKRMRQFLDAPAITAVVGLRRVGKSVLLRQFAASLRSERQVVYVDMESLENLVYLELRRRGYRVSVGVAGSREVDFVAESSAGRRYVQVAYLLDSRATIERELSAFAAIPDAYPRILFTLDPHQPPDFAGVSHRSLASFLRGAPLTG